MVKKKFWPGDLVVTKSDVLCIGLKGKIPQNAACVVIKVVPGSGVNVMTPWGNDWIRSCYLEHMTSAK